MCASCGGRPVVRAQLSVPAPDAPAGLRAHTRHCQAHTCRPLTVILLPSIPTHPPQCHNPPASAPHPHALPTHRLATPPTTHHRWPASTTATAADPQVHQILKQIVTLAANAPETKDLVRFFNLKSELINEAATTLGEAPPARLQRSRGRGGERGVHSFL